MASGWLQGGFGVPIKWLSTGFVGALMSHCGIIGRFRGYFLHSSFFILPSSLRRHQVKARAFFGAAHKQVAIAQCRCAPALAGDRLEPGDFFIEGVREYVVSCWYGVF
jgi:hypothetical protein